MATGCTQKNSSLLYTTSILEFPNISLILAVLFLSTSLDVTGPIRSIFDGPCIVCEDALWMLLQLLILTITLEMGAMPVYFTRKRGIKGSG